MLKVRNRGTVTIALVMLLATGLFCVSCDSSSAPSSTSIAPITTNNVSGDKVSPTGSSTPNPGGGLPQLATKPRPVTGTYQGCPPQGDSGDAQLNILKNRTDTAQWYAVPVATILNLGWPRGIEGKKRSTWSQADAAQIARYEGIPIQLEGYLAGAKQEGPESPNCHAADDVDNHLWLADNPDKDRSKAIVVEITPRVRALHAGWAFERVSPLVDGRTKIRISGWLMMDQEHPDQVAKTRGTIWEVHPIMDIEVQRGGNWVSLDTGRIVSDIQGAAGGKTGPTPTPLPADLEEPADEAVVATATPLSKGSRSGGRATASSPVRIEDIVYKGSGGSNDLDEYVEIANTGNSSVNLEGWVLRDVYGGQEFKWPNFSIQPGQHIRVYTGGNHPESGSFSFGSGKPIWNNKGDAAELLDGSGKVVSSFAYGDKR